MEILGTKVRHYAVFKCPHCKESFEVDSKILFEAQTKDSENTATTVFTLVCPWCEGEQLYRNHGWYSNRIVKVD